MSDWLISLEGTEAGHQLALALALLAAVLHAVFGALQKGRYDPWVTRASIDLGLLVLSFPLLFLVPFPEPHMWPIFAAVIGWLFLRETVGPKRIALMVLIALGAVIVEAGG